MHTSLTIFYCDTVKYTLNFTIFFYFTLIYIFFHIGFWIYFHSLIVPNKYINCNQANPIKLTTSFCNTDLLSIVSIFDECLDFLLLLFVVFASCFVFFHLENVKINHSIGKIIAHEWNSMRCFINGKWLKGERKEFHS